MIERTSYMSLLATKIYNVCWHMTYLTGIFADFLGAIKRLALWVRDTFFRFIPREAIFEADANLRGSLKELIKTPSGLFYGLVDSLKAATFPWLSVTVLVIAFLVTSKRLDLLLPTMRTTLTLQRQKQELFAAVLQALKDGEKNVEEKCIDML